MDVATCCREGVRRAGGALMLADNNRQTGYYIEFTLKYDGREFSRAYRPSYPTKRAAVKQMKRWGNFPGIIKIRVVKRDEITVKEIITHA
jgi:hypothetical protein